MIKGEGRYPDIIQAIRSWRLVLMLMPLLVSGCSGLPSVVEPGESHTPPERSIYVVSHGWHTGLVIPAVALNLRVPGLAERFGTPAFYEIGWGDKGFYQAKEITTGLSLQAMFWSSGAVLHVVAVPDSPYLSFPYSEVMATCVTSAELASLLTFLANSFQQDEGGRILPLAAGIYGEAQFYAGVGGYHLLNTCNTWTAKGLNSAGQRISPGFTLTAGGVMESLVTERRDCARLERATASVPPPLPGLGDRLDPR